MQRQRQRQPFAWEESALSSPEKIITRYSSPKPPKTQRTKCKYKDKDKDINLHGMNQPRRALKKLIHVTHHQNTKILPKIDITQRQSGEVVKTPKSG